MIPLPRPRPDGPDQVALFHAWWLYFKVLWLKGGWARSEALDALDLYKIKSSYESGPCCISLHLWAIGHKVDQHDIHWSPPQASRGPSFGGWCFGFDTTLKGVAIIQLSPPVKHWTCFPFTRGNLNIWFFKCILRSYRKLMDPNHFQCKHLVTRVLESY